MVHMDVRKHNSIYVRRLEIAFGETVCDVFLLHKGKDRQSTGPDVGREVFWVLIKTMTHFIVRLNGIEGQMIKVNCEKHVGDMVFREYSPKPLPLLPFKRLTFRQPKSQTIM